jgi:2-polyprenyl-6-methoxyphenol hydroxylase-like FAD-dependent oxidoreductase
VNDWKAQQVLIVGGGIGGLAAALALARKGIPVQVIEQAPEFKEIGADQRARGVPQQPHHDGFGHRAGGHAHSARRFLPQ